MAPAARPQLWVQTWGLDLGALRRFARAAEVLGFDGVTYGDGPFDWTHDTWVVLALLAADTRSIGIGPSVTFLLPAWRSIEATARAAGAVQDASEGRLELRIGFGAEEGRADWEDAGIAFPSPAERIALVADGVPELRDRLGDVPIWLSASGPRAFEVAEVHADGVELSFVPPTEVPDVRTDRLSVEVDVALDLDAFLADRGLDAEDPVARAALTDDAPAQLAAYAAAGVTHLHLGLPDVPDTASLEALADLLELT